jgi:hypothetical protein
VPPFDEIIKGVIDGILNASEFYAEVTPDFAIVEMWHSSEVGS